MLGSTTLPLSRTSESLRLLGLLGLTLKPHEYSIPNHAQNTCKANVITATS